LARVNRGKEARQTITMRNEIEKELDKALGDLRVPPEAFRKCAPDQAKGIVERARDRFVFNNPRAWWMSLKHPYESFNYSDGFGFEDLIRHIPEGNEKCWFVSETEKEYAPVFDVNVNWTSRVLGECFSFEYYLVGKQFDWLITENDHNQVIVCRL
jgi:hypothetical protein